MEFDGCCQAVFRAAFAALHTVTLAGDPLAQVGVGQALQKPPTFAASFAKLVVVDQRMEAIAFAAVPDVPHERTVMEQLAVFLEEAITEPVVQIDVRLDVARMPTAEAAARRRVLRRGPPGCRRCRRCPRTWPALRTS